MYLRKTTVVIVIGMIIIGVTACGKKLGNTTPGNDVDAASSIVVNQENNSENNDGDSQENELLGMFHDENTILILENDNTFAKINANKQYCIEGTYVISDEQEIQLNGEDGDQIKGIYENGTWVLGEEIYTKAGITGSYSNEKLGDGIIVQNDNTFTVYRDFDNKAGKIIGTYEREKYVWRFSSPGFEEGVKTGVFDGNQWIFEGDCYERNYGNNIPNVVTGLCGIYMNGEKVSVLGCRVKNLSELGIKINEDIENTYLESGKISDNIRVVYKGAVAEVKVINTYENKAPLSECSVFSFYTEDMTGTFQMDNEGKSCGQELYDDLLNVNVYEYTSNQLVYKKYLILALDFDVEELNDPKGKQIIELNGECNLILNFSDNVLASFCYVCSDYANGGLGSNVDSSAVKNADDASIEAAIKVRDDILTQLKDIFERSGIAININESTGEISMDNGILFEKDSYKMSSEGEKYIDTFFSTYAKVLMSKQFKDHIAQINFEGHTDSSGEFGYNKILSERRAQNVLDYCIHSSGMTETEEKDMEKLSKAVGYSSSNLIYDESGKEDQNASRRVVIKFIVQLDNVDS